MQNLRCAALLTNIIVVAVAVAIQNFLLPLLLLHVIILQVIRQLDVVFFFIQCVIEGLACLEVVMRLHVG